ncbi:hypothetical protein K1719_025261 [Acacia pycnantha]|nr:hypothetical protein K1719_025261 [Acacia pycnantha]
MPVRDVVSWNTMISGYSSHGFGNQAFQIFVEMQNIGTRPSVFTYTIMMSLVSSPCQGKQIHGRLIRSGMDFSNLVLGNSLINMTSRISFRAVPSSRKGLEDSVQLFREQYQWDSALCSSMISSYASHGLGDEALGLFVLTLRKNLRPTEYMVSCLLSCFSSMLQVELGNQIHSLVLKLGFESDAIVANSLVEMYSKFGFIYDALDIFSEIRRRDLISWNTILTGLIYNGEVSVAMDLFNELIREGMSPDRITLAAVLLACNYGSLVDEGIQILSSMEKEFGVKPGEQHYAFAVELLSRAGRLKEAIDIIEAMPCRTALIWKSILSTCAIHEDLRFTERVAKEIVEMEPQSPLPYLVLAQAYQMRGKWESMVRVRKAVEHKGAKEFAGCSWIGIKNHVYSFEANKLHHYGGKDLYLVLKLLHWEMETEGYA